MRDAVIESLLQYIKDSVVRDCEVIDTDKVIDFYITHDKEQLKKPDKRTVIEIVGYWAPKFGKSFFYNKNIEKGEIIDVLFKKMEKMKENCKPPSPSPISFYIKFRKFFYSR